MFCDRCGVQVESNQSFCPRCGKALSNVPLMPVQSRIAGHLRLLGILWLALSVFRLLPGIFLLSVFRPEMRLLPPEVPPFVFGLVQTVGFGLVAVAILGIITGWGLLTRQGWARLMALIFGGLSLIDMPFGTALGVYSFWVLLPAQSEEEYRQIAQAA